MDSLLASYASSDEEEAATRPPLPPPSLHSTTASSLFSSLPPPTTTTTTSSLFSSLPPPRSGKAGKPDPSSSKPNPTKKVVFLKPLWSSSDLGSDDEDDDGEKKAKAKEKEEKQAAQGSKSQTLFLPAPKHSFGLAPPPPSAGRRALVEMDTTAAAAAVTATKPESTSYGEKAASLGVDGAAASDYGYCSSGYTAEGSSDPYPVVGCEGHGGYGDYNNHEKVESTSYGEKAAASGVDGAAASDYGYYSSDPYCNVGGDGFGGYPQYGSGWGDGAMAAPAPRTDFVVEDWRRNKGKRGRDEVPAEVVEVKQDELVKNRPREDQTRMTGIAFGPAYQPVSSGKGKPSKLHKRKHQIGSLYFDMKQKEMELTERRARGLQTKSETQGKYGWS